MIGNIAAWARRTCGVVSAAVRDGPGRIAVVALVVVLVGLSGYMAAASGATMDVSLGGDAADPAAVTTDPATSVTVQGIVRGAESGGGATTASARGHAADRDDDALTDRAEREIYGTDPTASDTDGDGIPDGAELVCSAAYPGADPRRHDVYVELDSVDGVRLSATTVARLRAAFANAPVENPDGTSGITLHVVRSDTELPEQGVVNDDPRPGAYNDVEDYRTAHFQRRPAGYYYLLVVTDAAYNGDASYAGAGKPGTAVVEHYDRDGVMSSLVAHELGHAFGLGRSEAGVDAREYSRAEYHSVMNYNGLYEITTYSDGSGRVGRDEWAYVANDRYRPAVQRKNGNRCPAVGT